jgi:hypothetical protein
MRALFALLLLLNLAFFGWARFVGGPAREPVRLEKPGVPTLHLASEPGARTAAAARCVSIGPFVDARPQAMWQAALEMAALTPRARFEGDPPQGWLDVDLPTGQSALDFTRLPGSPPIEGIRQGTCASRSVNTLPPPATVPAEGAPAPATAPEPAAPATTPPAPAAERPRNPAIG